MGLHSPRFRAPRQVGFCAACHSGGQPSPRWPGPHARIHNGEGPPSHPPHQQHQQHPHARPGSRPMSPLVPGLGPGRNTETRSPLQPSCRSRQEAAGTDIGRCQPDWRWTSSRTHLRAFSAKFHQHWQKKNIKGTELSKKTLGIIGFGNVGQRLSNLVKGFDVNILVNSKSFESRQKDFPEIKNVSFDKLITESDIISNAGGEWDHIDITV